KEAHKAGNVAELDKLTEALNAAWHAASEDMAKAAQAAGPQGGAQAGPNPGAGAQGGNKDGEVTDVDFEEVK
ncbi:MAG: molecular chaperone DnaK, partial [Bacteroidales bacterium]|nr:molecular chaperone DnaK [Bacteroidales bacterium]